MNNGTELLYGHCTLTAHEVRQLNSLRPNEEKREREKNADGGGGGWGWEGMLAR